MSSEGKKSSGFKRTVLTALLSLAVGAGGFWYYQNSAIAKSESTELASVKGGESPEPRPMAPAAAPVFVEFEPFTVTFDSPGRSSRILYLGLTVRVQDKQSQDQIKQFMPVARSSVLTMLGELDPNTLNDRETKILIRDAVTKELSKPFSANLHGQLISDVLFTAFVVQ